MGVSAIAWGASGELGTKKAWIARKSNHSYFRMRATPGNTALNHIFELGLKYSLSMSELSCGGRQKAELQNEGIPN
ncbi:unnamed protein product [Dovyalis caffra]|uniref:Uncharacterized protein n=1 Tax=Dovyalis caffra TaxID=77055 RepID=A0AAV1RNK1_9ROSI|nr:unnamed protein product [Dovyalis caffra]